VYKRHIHSEDAEKVSIQLENTVSAQDAVSVRRVGRNVHRASNHQLGDQATNRNSRRVPSL